MFTTHTEEGYQPVLEGIQIKTLVVGERSLLSEFHLEKGHPLPRHAHPQEQSGYLVSGHIRLTIGSEVFDALPGSSWCVPANVEHGAEVVEDAVAIEVFIPVREDYLKYLQSR